MQRMSGPNRGAQLEIPGKFPPKTNVKDRRFPSSATVSHTTLPLVYILEGHSFTWHLLPVTSRRFAWHIKLRSAVTYDAYMWAERKHFLAYYLHIVSKDLYTLNHRITADRNTGDRCAACRHAKRCETSDVSRTPLYIPAFQVHVKIKQIPAIISKAEAETAIRT
jgi:hypothetical protein